MRENDSSVGVSYVWFRSCLRAASLSEAYHPVGWSTRCDLRREADFCSTLRCHFGDDGSGGLLWHQSAIMAVRFSGGAATQPHKRFGRPVDRSCRRRGRVLLASYHRRSPAVRHVQLDSRRAPRRVCHRLPIDRSVGARQSSASTSVIVAVPDIAACATNPDRSVRRSQRHTRYRHADKHIRSARQGG